MMNADEGCVAIKEKEKLISNNNKVLIAKHIKALHTA